MRYFIALTLNKEHIKRIGEISAKIKKEIDRHKVKYTQTKPQNIHITIKFIGSQITERTKLKKIVDEIHNKIPSTLTTTRINNFGGRIIFLDIKEQEILRSIHHEICNKLNLEKDKFHAHITLFRIKNTRMNISYEVNTEIKVDAIVLFNSTLTPQGPIYEKVYERKIHQ